jgi:hypothetical protein
MEVSDGVFVNRMESKCRWALERLGFNYDRGYEEGPEDSQMSAEAPSEKLSSCEANILYRLSGFGSSLIVIHIRPIA